METLTVELGDRSYPIYAGSGLFDDHQLLARHIGGRNVLVVTDDNVAEHYLAPLLRALGNHQCSQVILPAGEKHKNLDAAAHIYDALLRDRFDRNCTVLALGGGVVGDIAGFAAATYQRGVPYLQIPTTLLAQVDSSVGGKTGVNHALGKNMIGAFHQPLAVLADMQTLSTLPAREYRAGLAEVIKYGLINQPDFFQWLTANIDTLLRQQPQPLAQAVLSCCRFKAEIVAADEREAGQRALLNLGHTFGHAIENAAGYGNWLHGEAVAAGICMAAHFSRDAGLLDGEALQQITDLLQRAGLPVAPPEGLDTEHFLQLMSRDKKVRDNVLTLVLMRGIGESFLTANYDRETLRQSISTIFNTNRE